MKKDKNAKVDIQKLLNIVIVFLIVVLLLLVGYYFYSSKNEVTGTKLKLEKSKSELLFPSLDSKFDFKTVDGKDFKVKTSNKKIEIEGLTDKLIFLKIFGWDCKYCQKEIPQLINLKKDLGDTFEVIAIEAEKHSNEESLKYIKKYGINYDIVNGNEQKRFYDYLQVHYGWSGLIPLTIVLGKGGNILAYEVGVKSYTLAELMKASLAKEK
ncbi:MAG TPA: TlpA family protein disulfide reductase [Campylobacterales bacterium]|nr:TlpA family protein disulfide reductase [Campylobacterales bacterium]HHD81035.1 TlpA family protein disulfide reductase [Campylobacterales bacterium]